MIVLRRIPAVALRRTQCLRVLYSTESERQHATGSKAIPKGTAVKVPEDPLDFSRHRRRQNLSDINEEVASQVPSLIALKARLGLSDKFQFSTLARTLISPSSDLKFVDNQGMSTFGNILLSYYIQEHVMTKYPRLPLKVHCHLVSTYMEERALYKIGSSWGVEVDSKSDAFLRYLADKTDEDMLGKLVFSQGTVKREEGVEEIIKDKVVSQEKLTHAVSSFVKALVAGIYAHDGIDAAREFIHNYIIKPQVIDVSSILVFRSPSRELSALCAREKLEPPVSRLLAETGRFSKVPVFVVGIFSGDLKIGEGQGSSLREARTRATVHALKSWYLYSPIEQAEPSNPELRENYKPNYIDTGAPVI